MTTLARIAIAFILSIFLTSCGFDIQIGDFGTGKKGNGNVVTATRPISEEFTKISTSEGLVVYVTQAKDFNIKVEADDNVIDLIKTEIKNGKLRIHARENIGKATKNIFVSLPEVASLHASSGSYLEVQNNLKSNHLAIDGSSGAVLEVNLTAQKLDIDASSGASLRVSGASNTADVDVSSGGTINAQDLETTTCTAEASSGGNVKIQVSKSLVADASSGGNISYSGDATVEQKKSVSGSVHKY